MTENERRNLFTYATKKLSQDALLLWLFNNYDDEDVAPAAYALLREFCGLAPDEKVLSLETKAQWHDIDVSVWFETDQGRKHALFIEDKVDSGEHNQLLKYNKYIKLSEEEGYKVSKIYYKPGYLYPDEIERVKNAGWKHFKFDEICNLLKPFVSSSDPIVRMYIEHILAREEALSTTEKPKRSENAVDLLAWLSFYGNAVIPSLEQEFGQRNAKFDTWRAGRYLYVCLSARHEDDDCIPYLEIRSRDCVGGKFKALLLCYDVKDELRKQRLIQRVAEQHFFSQKGMRKDNPKQIGWRVESGVETTEEFLAAVKRSVREFLDLMKDWD